MATLHLKPIFKFCLDTLTPQKKKKRTQTPAKTGCENHNPNHTEQELLLLKAIVCVKVKLLLRSFFCNMPLFAHSPEGRRRTMCHVLSCGMVLFRLITNPFLSAEETKSVSLFFFYITSKLFVRYL